MTEKIAKSIRSEPEPTLAQAPAPAPTGKETSHEGAKSALSIGDAIKRLRVKRGMSLQALAEVSGVSAGMLSQIERGLANPSLRILNQIQQALDAPVTALFGDVVAPFDPDFVRRASRRPKLRLGYLDKELLSWGMPHNLQMMILHLPPGGSSGEKMLSYPAEKGGLVLNGSISLTVGDDVVQLYEGDSFMFDSQIPHAFQNIGKSDARVLWVIGQVSVDRHI